MIEEYSEEKAKLESYESGQLQAKQAIAKNLLSLGLDYSAIAQATGLTHAEIEALSN